MPFTLFLEFQFSFSLRLPTFNGFTQSDKMVSYFALLATPFTNALHAFSRISIFTLASLGLILKDSSRAISFFLLHFSQSLLQMPFTLFLEFEFSFSLRLAFFMQIPPNFFTNALHASSRI
jgi:hypothetical protein